MKRSFTLRPTWLVPPFVMIFCSCLAVMEIRKSIACKMGTFHGYVFPEISNGSLLRLLLILVGIWGHLFVS